MKQLLKNIKKWFNLDKDAKAEQAACCNPSSCACKEASKELKEDQKR